MIIYRVIKKKTVLKNNLEHLAKSFRCFHNCIVLKDEHLKKLIDFFNNNEKIKQNVSEMRNILQKKGISGQDISFMKILEVSKDPQIRKHLEIFKEEVEKNKIRLDKGNVLEIIKLLFNKSR